MNADTKIFVNLPVQDLKRSVDFFTKLGFTFNAQYTDENATCMVINESIYVMLLVKPFFLTFTDKPIGEATKATEVIIALTISSRAKIDEMVNIALAAGALLTSSKADQSAMYARSFHDLDGHIWELFYMDAPKE